MKTVNQVKIELEDFLKCHVICDADCPIGSLYDFSCAFQFAISKRIKEIEESKQPPQPDTSKETIPE